MCPVESAQEVHRNHDLSGWVRGSKGVTHCFCHTTHVTHTHHTSRTTPLLIDKPQAEHKGYSEPQWLISSRKVGRPCSSASCVCEREVTINDLRPQIPNEPLPRAPVLSSYQRDYGTAGQDPLKRPYMEKNGMVGTTKVPLSPTHSTSTRWTPQVRAPSTVKGNGIISHAITGPPPRDDQSNESYSRVLGSDPDQSAKP